MKKIGHTDGINEKLLLFTIYTFKTPFLRNLILDDEHKIK